MVKARYLEFNPFSLMSFSQPLLNDQELRKSEIQERILTAEEWNALLETLKNMPESNNEELKNKLLLKLLIYLLFFLGLRISEVEQSTWNAFREIEGKWWFFVIGKGRCHGKIPVHDQLLDCIRAYRLSHDLSPSSRKDLPDRDMPILCNFKIGQAYTSRYMNYLLKEIAGKAAEQFKNQPKKAEKLKKFSAHWLRHLSASMQDQAGISFKHIRENHRHVNDATTRLYVHAFDKDRHADMQKLQLQELKTERAL